MHFRGATLLTALIISLYHLPLEGARILVSLPMPFKSQTMSLSGLVKELLARGHEVTMITSIPMEQNLANYQEILLDSKLFVLPEGTLIQFSPTHRKANNSFMCISMVKVQRCVSRFLTVLS